MAIKNKVISNPVTKQQIRFLRTAKDTGGALLEMETRYGGRSLEPPPHYHPYQEETFTVLEGEITVRMDGQLKVLGRGDTLHVPRNMVHSMWNNRDGAAVVNWQVRPALNTEHFLETAMGLASDGKVNQKGMPSVLQVALMARAYSDVFRLSRPSLFLQRALFLPLIPLAYLFGYRPSYRRYID